VAHALERGAIAWARGARIAVRVLALAAAFALCTCAAPLVARAHAETTTLGLGGWQVQSSALAPQAGGQISEPGFPTGNWLAVKPDDAGAVGTEIDALLQNGACPNVFFSEEMKRCFGYMEAIGPETVAQFAVPWWFARTSTRARGWANTRS
jgi:exo-1,4-beta-D-glucosaminidase